MSEKSLLLIITLAMATLAVQPINRPALGHSGDSLSAWASRTPTIDGGISSARTLCGSWGCLYIPGDWDDAASIDFTLSYEAEVHDATLYLKNDYVNLYLALVIRGEDYNPLDYVLFAFDGNHDGLLEVGDNVLGLQDNKFDDGFMAILPMNDVDDGGTDDGVGASSFRGESDYHFEVAFPLNTTDNAHDFSLSIDATVGFFLSFWDNDAGESGRWPSDTFADIIIAGPPTPPPASGVDLGITGIEVTQAIQFLNNSIPLVKGRTTVVRAYVDIGPVSGPIFVMVYLYGFDGHVSFGGLSTSFLAPATPDRGDLTHTANFLLPADWVNPSAFDGLTLTAFVKTSSGQSETNYNNNWMSRETFFLSRSRSFKIGYYAIDYRPTAPSSSPNLPSSRILNGHNWFEKVVPLPDISDPVDYRRLGSFQWTTPIDKVNDPGYPNNVHALIRQLNRLYIWRVILAAISRGLFGIDVWVPDKVFAWVPSNVGQFGGHSDMSLFPHAGGLDVVSVGADRPNTGQTTFTHEITHTMQRRHAPGCGAPGPDPSWPYANAKIQTYGFDTRLFQVKDPATTFDYMSYCQPRWTSPYTYKALFSSLSSMMEIEAASFGASLNPSQVLGGLIVSGVVFKNGTGALDPVYQVPTNYTTPTGPPGLYSIELWTGPNRVYNQSFHVSFEEEDDVPPEVGYFTMVLPHPQGVDRIAFKYNTSILDEVKPTPNAPKVNVIYPNGGEQLGDSLTAKWNGSDADGGTLTYSLFYSSDNGTTWQILALDVTDPFYFVNGSDLPGGSESLIRVVATDGFHTSEDQSDWVFNVPRKSPRVTVLQPSQGIDVSWDEPFILRAHGSDPEDGVLPDSSLLWTSDSDGPLGTGRVLMLTELTPGNHTITLTGRDSDGNNATDTTTIRVQLPVAVNVVPSRTVVGQGGTVRVDVNITNRGEPHPDFDITARVSNATHEAMIYSQTVHLPMGNSTTLTIDWNTTGFAKGSYNVSVTAGLIEYDVTGFSDTILVAMVGDVTGPNGVPDGKVDIRDIAVIAILFGVKHPEPDYNPNYDIIFDGKIDIRDIATAAKHFGEIDP